MFRRKKAAEPAGPCDHADAWAPEAIAYRGMTITYLAVVCLACGWQGQVPPSAFQKEQADA